MYAPSPAPANSEELQRFLNEQLAEVSRQSATLTPVDLILQEVNVAPARPQNGQVVYADGTNWNPGSGRGIYYFNGSTWNFLG